jgi:hypothetical protein
MGGENNGWWGNGGKFENYYNQIMNRYNVIIAAVGVSPTAPNPFLFTGQTKDNLK